MTFLVEHYWPMVNEALLRASLPRLETAVGAMRSAGHRIDHLGFLLVPTDQVAFSVIRASSEAIAREVYGRAHVRVDRIAAVTPVGFDLRDACRKGSPNARHPTRHRHRTTSKLDCDNLVNTTTTNVNQSLVAVDALP